MQDLFSKYFLLVSLIKVPFPLYQPLVLCFDDRLTNPPIDPVHTAEKNMEIPAERKKRAFSIGFLSIRFHRKSSYENFW